MADDDQQFEDADAAVTQAVTSSRRDRFDVRKMGRVTPVYHGERAGELARKWQADR
jgi:hypothetical protein